MRHVDSTRARLKRPLDDGNSETAAMATATGSAGTVSHAVRASTDAWAADLRRLFDNAQERFADVCWDALERPEDAEDGIAPTQDGIWGHKAIVYARAPKAFKDRYFPPTAMPRPFASMERGGRSPYSPAPSLLPAHSSSSLQIPRGPSPSNGNARSTSALSIASDGRTLPSTLRLTYGGTPEMFRAQLEWLYTSEGMGDVVEWISDQDHVGSDFLEPSQALTGSLRDSRGRKGGLDDRREKLGQDLTYMWRSKLYADVEIHLVTNDPPAAPTLADDSDYDSSSSTASLASTAIFSSHRFILCSRSPYFASLLLNQSQFRPSSSSINRITLPSPPFTPAALHFCLGYLYNGTLNFSNRSYDLATAFQIHRCASYLQLDPLRDEVESRITWDFCHGLDPTLCACRRCGIRAARVWRFACAPDVAAVALGRRAREWLVKGWADSWGKDVGEISKTERDALVEQVVVGINPCNVLSTFRGLARVRARLDASSDWQAQLEDMLHAIESRATQVLMLQFADVADSQDVLVLLDGTSFEADVLETVLNVVKDHVGRAEWYAQSGRIYQALVSSFLLRIDPETMDTVLKTGSSTRQLVEHTREAVLGHLKKRWMLARDQNAFHALEHWALKEISDEIDVPISDLLSDDTAPVRTVATTPPRSRLISATSSLRLHSSPPRAQPLRANSNLAPAQGSHASNPSLRAIPNQNRKGKERPSEPAALARARDGAVTPGTGTANPSQNLKGKGRASDPVAPSGVGKSRASDGAVTPGTGTGMGNQNQNMKGKGRATELPAPSSSGKARASGVAVTPGPGTATANPSQNLKGKGRASEPAALAPAPNVNDPKGKARASDSASVRSNVTATSRAPSVSSTKARPATASSSRPSTTTVRAPLIKSATTSSASVTSLSSKIKSTPRPSITMPSTTVAARSASATSLNLKSKAAVAPASRPPSTTPLRPMPSTRKSPAVATTSTSSPENPKRPSSVNSVRSTKSVKSTISTSTANFKPTPPLPKNARTAIATHITPSNPSLAPSSPASGPPRQRAKSTASRLANASVSPLPHPTKVSAVTAARMRTASLNGTTASKIARPSGLSAAHRGPAASRSKVSAAASQFGGQPTLRSPSGSTDDTEMQTPKAPQVLLVPPALIRSTSTGSELADLLVDPIIDHSAPTPSSPKLMLSISPAPSPDISMAPVCYPRAGSPSGVMTNSSPRSRYHPAAAFDPPKADIKSALPIPKVQVDDGMKPLPADHGVTLGIGIPCIVSLQKKRARFKAFARYIGRLEGCKGPWVGVEVDELSQEKFGLDTSDGSREGTRYFHISSPSVDDITDPLERAARRRRIENISADLVKTGLTSSKMAGLGLGADLFPQTNSHDEYRGPRGSLSRSSSPFGERMSTDPWATSSWLGESQPRGLFVRPSEVVFVEGAE